MQVTLLQVSFFAITTSNIKSFIILKLIKLRKLIIAKSSLTIMKSHCTKNMKIKWFPFQKRWFMRKFFNGIHIKESGWIWSNLRLNQMICYGSIHFYSNSYSYNVFFYNRIHEVQKIITIVQFANNTMRSYDGKTGQYLN